MYQWLFVLTDHAQLADSSCPVHQLLHHHPSQLTHPEISLYPHLTTQIHYLNLSFSPKCKLQDEGGRTAAGRRACCVQSGGSGQSASLGQGIGCSAWLCWACSPSPLTPGIACQHTTSKHQC